jgi:hypothetical protein
MLAQCCGRYGESHAVEFATVGCRRYVAVYDVQSDAAKMVSRAEAAAGVMRYARSLGAGSPACGEAERRALQIARGEQVGAC